MKHLNLILLNRQKVIFLSVIWVPIAFFLESCGPGETTPHDPTHQKYSTSPIQGNNETFGAESSQSQLDVPSAARDSVKQYTHEMFQQVMNNLDKPAFAFDLVFNPDGKQLAAAGSDCNVHIWNVENWRKIAKFKDGEDVGCPNTVAYSPNDDRIAIGYNSGVIIIRQTDSYQRTATISGHDDRVTDIVFSPNGKHIVTSSADCTIRIWDAHTYAAVDKIPNLISETNEIAVSPDGKQIAGSVNNTVRIWDADSLKLVKTLKGHPNSVSAIAFDPTGSYLASGSAPSQIRLWDPKSGKLISTMKDKYLAGIDSISFNIDGTRIFTGTDIDIISIWDIKRLKPLINLEKHQHAVNAVAISPDGKTLVSSARNDSTYVWDVDTLNTSDTLVPIKTLQEYRRKILVAALVDHSKQFVAVLENGDVQIWDPTSGELVRQHHMDISKTTTATVSPNGRYIAVGAQDRDSVFDVQEISLIDMTDLKGTVLMKGIEDDITSLVFSPDGKTIVIGTKNGTIRLFNTDTHAETGTLKGHKGELNTVVFRPNGKQIVSGSANGSMFIWNAQTHKRIRSKELWDAETAYQVGVSALVFDPKKERLLSIAWGNSLSLLNADTYAPIAEIDPMTIKRDYCLAENGVFSPAGNQLVTFRNDELDPQSTLCLWTPDSMTLVIESSPINAYLTSIEFSADGNHLFGAFEDGTIRTWNPHTAEMTGLWLSVQNDLWLSCKKQQDTWKCRGNDDLSIPFSSIHLRGKRI